MRGYNIESKPALGMRMNKNSEQDNFGRLKDLVRVMARAIFTSLIVHGGAGAETMDIVAGTLTEEGLVQNKDWFVIEGKVTPFVLYQILFKHRKGDILVFDHVDSIWNHQVVVDMLKSALDSYDVCTVGWLSQRTLNVFRMNGEEKEAYNDKVDQEIRESSNGRIGIKFPSQFIYEGRTIFMSNLPREKFPDTIRSRSLGIDMTRNN